MTNFYGKNICFYYYGEDHLVMNLYKYIKQQVENNNFVYMYIDEDIYKILINNLDTNEKSMVENINIEKLLYTASKDEFTTSPLSKFLNDLNRKSLEQGFWRVNFIFDSSRLLTTSCKSTFLDCIKEISSICLDNQVNVLTCYDFLDYINRGKIISETIMKYSYTYHDYRMFGNDIIPIENFNINRNIG